jgi:hypothetical protein
MDISPSNGSAVARKALGFLDPAVFKANWLFPELAPPKTKIKVDFFVMEFGYGLASVKRRELLYRTAEKKLTPCNTR